MTVLRILGWVLLIGVDTAAVVLTGWFVVYLIRTARWLVREYRRTGRLPEWPA